MILSGWLENIGTVRGSSALQVFCDRLLSGCTDTLEVLWGVLLAPFNADECRKMSSVSLGRKGAVLQTILPLILFDEKKTFPTDALPCLLASLNQIFLTIETEQGRSSEQGNSGEQEKSSGRDASVAETQCTEQVNCIEQNRTTELEGCGVLLLEVLTELTIALPELKTILANPTFTFGEATLFHGHSVYVECARLLVTPEFPHALKIQLLELTGHMYTTEDVDTLIKAAAVYVSLPLTNQVGTIAKVFTNLLLVAHSIMASGTAASTQTSMADAPVSDIAQSSCKREDCVKVCVTMLSKIAQLHWWPAMVKILDETEADSAELTQLMAAVATCVELVRAHTSLDSLKDLMASVVAPLFHQLGEQQGGKEETVSRLAGCVGEIASQVLFGFDLPFAATPSFVLDVLKAFSVISFKDEDTDVQTTWQQILTYICDSLILELTNERSSALSTLQSCADFQAALPAVIESCVAPLVGQGKVLWKERSHDGRAECLNTGLFLVNLLGACTTSREVKRVVSLTLKTVLDRCVRESAGDKVGFGLGVFGPKIVSTVINAIVDNYQSSEWDELAAEIQLIESVQACVQPAAASLAAVQSSCNARHKEEVYREYCAACEYLGAWQ